MGISANSRTETLAALPVVAGALLLAVAPSAPASILSLAMLVAGFALRPALGLPLLAFVLPFYLLPKSFGSMAFSLPELILLCACAGAALYALRKWIGGYRISMARLVTPLDGPAALFLAAALLSLLASEVLRVSLRDLRTLVLEPMAAYYLAAWFLRRRSDQARVLAALLLGGAVVAAIGLYQYLFTDHVVAVEGARRILGPYLSPNHLGLYLGRLLPMAVAVALYLPGARIAATPLAVSLAAALFLTFSLGAWLSSSLALLAVALLWRARAALLLGGTLVALLAMSGPLLSLERISSHFSLTRGTSFLRLQVWESALRMIRDHPLLGVGMDNFLYHYRGSYLLPEAVAEPNLSHPHNLVLNFWLQMGLLGLVAAAWLLVALARYWHRLWRTSLDPLDRAILAGIAGATVDLVAHGMVDNSYFLVDLAFHFWLSAGLVAALWGSKLSPQGRIE